MSKKDGMEPLGERFQEQPKEEVLDPSIQAAKAPRRARHSFYLETAMVLRLDQAYKQLYHERYPREISKSDFLETCLRYALSHLDEIGRNLDQDV